jgi:hypothetical protein
LAAIPMRNREILRGLGRAGILTRLKGVVDPIHGKT